MKNIEGGEQILGVQNTTEIVWRNRIDDWSLGRGGVDDDYSSYVYAVALCEAWQKGQARKLS